MTGTTLTERETSIVTRSFTHASSGVDSRSRKRRARSLSVDSALATPKRARNESTRQAWETKFKLVVHLSDAILEFLACIVTQDEIPLLPVFTTTTTAAKKSKRSSTAGSDVDADDRASDEWNRARRQLDKTFRSLVTWKRDIKNDYVYLDDDRLLIEDVNGVLACLLAVAHHLTHLVDLDSARWDKDDKNAIAFKGVAQGLKNLGEKLLESNPSDMACQSCHRHAKKATDSGSVNSNVEKDREDYIGQVQNLVLNLKLESEPLQFALRRCNWMRQATESWDGSSVEQSRESTFKKDSSSK